jgi:hypothetical protein
MTSQVFLILLHLYIMKYCNFLPNNKDTRDTTVAHP